MTSRRAVTSAALILTLLVALVVAVLLTRGDDTAGSADVDAPEATAAPAPTDAPPSESATTAPTSTPEPTPTTEPTALPADASTTPVPATDGTTAAVFSDTPPIVAVLPVPEPSGLGWSSTGGLWVVSDDAPVVALVDEFGNELDRFGVLVGPESTDWEGVVETADGRLLVASERDRSILEIDVASRQLIGTIRAETLLGADDVATLIRSGGDNSGFEGITIAADGTVWVVKEKDPSLLIQFDADLSEVLFWTNPSALLAASLVGSPADLDLSGLTADPIDANTLWITSQTAAALFQWDLSTSTVVSSHRLPTPKAEGVAIGSDGRFHVVDDGSRHLLSFGSGTPE